jgi:uncharacterized membrane protein YdjX (TVP38/TMEM64 family)
MLLAKRSETLLSTVITSLAPTLLILVALTVAMLAPQHATTIILVGATVAAATFYLLRRYRMSRGVQAGPAGRQRHSITRDAVDSSMHRWPVNSRRPDAADKTVERVR